MNITLNWKVAEGPNSEGQNVQFKRKEDNIWLTHNDIPLSPFVTSYTISGLLDNQLYSFQVVNLCTLGGPINSMSAEGINITCASVTVTPTASSLIVQFPHLGGSINQYTITLYGTGSTGNEEPLEVFVLNSNFSGTLTHTFTGLVPDTQYKIKVVPAANNYEKTNCGLITASTASASVCLSPSNVTATLS